MFEGCPPESAGGPHRGRRQRRSQMDGRQVLSGPTESGLSADSPHPSSRIRTGRRGDDGTPRGRAACVISLHPGGDGRRTGHPGTLALPSGSGRGESVESPPTGARMRRHSGRPCHGNGCNLFESTTFWVVLFGLPVLAIVLIILLATYQSSGVQKDGRDDKTEDPTDG